MNICNDIATVTAFQCRDPIKEEKSVPHNRVCFGLSRGGPSIVCSKMINETMQQCQCREC